MRGFFDRGELPGDRSLHWPHKTDTATRVAPYNDLLEILLNCRHVGASGWYQFGMFDAFVPTASIWLEFMNIEYTFLQSRVEG